jgi:hypothetical protein
MYGEGGGGRGMSKRRKIGDSIANDDLNSLSVVVVVA